MIYTETILVILLMQNVHSTPLDIVAGKSGEEQVKEAIDRAEKESELAAKESIKTVAKAKVETQHFILKPVDLKETLDKKVEELSKLHEKHKDKQNEDSKTPDKDLSKLTKSESDVILSKLATSNEVSKFTKTDVELEKLAKAGDIKDLSKDTDIKEYIFKDTNKDNVKAKVSNEDVVKENAALEDESDKKMVDMAKKLNNLVLKFQKKMGRLATHSEKSETLISAASQLTDNKDGESTVKSIRGKPMSHAPIDLTALRNALGLAHLKPSSKLVEAPGKTSYKEDTKLEDRLAMEAEEEKKFSNGDTYDENGENNEDKDGEKSVASSLSPKEQASQEMQSYNALISSESNRELSQIQEEITKATQSSMGQVSVVGQKETVNTETPSYQNLGGGFGGSLGSLSGGLGGLGELGSANSGEQFQSLQAAATEGLDGLSGTSEISQQSPNGPVASQQQVSIEGQQPIEVGGSQEPVEMGTMGSNVNPFNSGSLQMDNMQQQSQQFANGQSPMDLTGQQGNDPNIAFKKSKITHRKNEIRRQQVQKNKRN
ncbi:uncharacterized protein LOC100209407 isoform X1 [Hydra vulgaris]|uniref:uncharacterized protein LOC100209407 isoform X1 n=1 Tax=Hydra vulgaris TaxID=6087 RepID=UPI00019265B3|nr:uncharacterized protein LOC100209407 isoform X1 [Hydra vulgaris]